MAKDKKEACKLAVEAGVNIELPEPDCYLHLVDLVRKGVLREKQLDDLVAPMLFWKFRMGLFDDPFVDPDEADRIVGCDAHRELARLEQGGAFLRVECRQLAVERGVLGRAEDAGFEQAHPAPHLRTHRTGSARPTSVLTRDASASIRVQAGYCVLSQSKSPASCAPGKARVSVWFR